jgi:hypothetical protein
VQPQVEDEMPDQHIPEIIAADDEIHSLLRQVNFLEDLLSSTRTELDTLEQELDSGTQFDLNFV